jgi:hypothetical protein
MVEYLPSKHKVLSSNPSTIKKREGGRKEEGRKTTKENTTKKCQEIIRVGVQLNGSAPA